MLPRRLTGQGGRGRATPWLLAVSALCVLAVLADGGAARAQIYLSRCVGADSWAAAAWLALRLDWHLRAFPWTGAAMALLCVSGPGGHGPRAIGARLGRMALAMPPACGAAAAMVAALPPGAQAYGYAAGMLAAMAGLEALWRARRRCGPASAFSRTAPPDARRTEAF